MADYNCHEHTYPGDSLDSVIVYAEEIVATRANLRRSAQDRRRSSSFHVPAAGRSTATMPLFRRPSRADSRDKTIFAKRFLYRQRVTVCRTRQFAVKEINWDTFVEAAKAQRRGGMSFAKGSEFRVFAETVEFLRLAANLCSSGSA
jgi:hypothetical protein